MTMLVYLIFAGIAISCLLSLGAYVVAIFRSKDDFRPGDLLFMFLDVAALPMAGLATLLIRMPHA
jgi:hypothetical protein